jgi:hypothetical protein
MSNFFKKLLYDDVPDVVTKEKPVTPLITSMPQAQVVNTAVNIAPVNPFIPKNYATQNVISPEDQEKWQNYFNSLLERVKKETPEYGHFLNNIDKVSEADASTPIINKFKFAFGFTGLTKTQLLTAANKAYEMVQNDRLNVFLPNQAKKIADGVDYNAQLIQEKQAAILANNEANRILSEEIQKCQIEMSANKEKIDTRAMCYDTLASQLLAKVAEDIKGVQSYII